MPKRKNKSESAYGMEMTVVRYQWLSDKLLAIENSLRNREDEGIELNNQVQANDIRLSLTRLSMRNHKEYIELLLADRQRRLNRKWWQIWK